MNIPMTGIRGISEELEQVVYQLGLDGLVRVVDAALDITDQEYSNDSDIMDAIEQYRNDPHAARALVADLEELSRKCDEQYQRLEDDGRSQEAMVYFQKMCILNGLSGLLGAPSVTPVEVDRFVYSTGHGFPDIDLFAERMVERLRSG
jgi:hypothetical protein